MYILKKCKPEQWDSSNGGIAPIGPNCLQIINMNSGENVNYPENK